MPQIKLIRPTAELAEQFLSMCAEYDNQYNAYNSLEDFQCYLKTCQKIEHDTFLPNGKVNAIVYWFIDEENSIIGTSRLRPAPAGRYLQVGGHIGYDVKPSARNQGCGTEILRLTLQEAVKQKLNQVLVTCDDDNPGSWKIIEKNGGILENKIDDPRDGKMVRRYWIELTS